MIKVTQILSKIVPPLISQKIRSILYPIDTAIRDNISCNKKSITGSYLKVNSSDFHGYKFFIHGFFDWRNIIIANSISKFRKGDIIEIGSNIGTETVSFCDIVGNQGKVFAFEPLPENIEKLKYLKQTQPNLCLKECALSNKIGEVDFLIPPNFSSGTGKILNNNSENKKTISIQTMTLDFYLKSFKSVSLVSIDTEGHEPQVLEGAKETLKFYKPFVIIEVSPKLLTKYSLIDPTHIYSYFKELDYMIFKISKLTIVKIKSKDLNTDKSYNWLCIPKENSKLIKKIKFDLLARSIFPWYILSKIKR